LAEPTKACPVRFGRARIAIVRSSRFRSAAPTPSSPSSDIVFAYDWKLAVDVLPVLSVAIVYVTCPWNSHVRPIIRLSRRQVRLVRLVLGFSFFALGWNEDLQPRRRDRRRPEFSDG